MGMMPPHMMGGMAPMPGHYRPPMNQTPMYMGGMPTMTKPRAPPPEVKVDKAGDNQRMDDNCDDV